MKELINEKDKNIVFSRHIFLPDMVMVGSLFTYLKTIPNLKCLLFISETVYKKINNKIKETITITDKDIFTFKGEPTLETLDAAREKVKNSNYDCILSIGGGSVIDLAKAIIKEKNMPLIAVPTTPATGSEATHYAVLTDTQNNKKIILSSKKLLPSVVVLDATLLETINIKQLGYSIMDIMAHGLEALVSKRANILSDSFALESIRLILENYTQIKEAYDKAVLEKILIAGFLGGLAQGIAAVGLIHAFAHYFGPKCNIPHSKAISIFIEPVLQLNIARSDKYNKLDSLKMASKENILDDIRKIKGHFKIEDRKIEIGKEFDKNKAIDSIKRDICALTNPIAPSGTELTEVLNKAVK